MQVKQQCVAETDKLAVTPTTKCVRNPDRLGSFRCLTSKSRLLERPLSRERAPSTATADWVV